MSERVDYKFIFIENYGPPGFKFFPDTKGTLWRFINQVIFLALYTLRVTGAVFASLLPL